MDPDDLAKLDPENAKRLMMPPLRKEKVLKFLEETKGRWGRESVEISDRIKAGYERIKDSETVNLARSSSQIVAHKVRVYMADIGLGNGPRVI